MPFANGDAVQLKSGGPKMTVTKRSEIYHDSYDCKWFAGSKLNEGLFSEDELKAYQEDEGKKK
jgi:uncharacterized protein YodC (DUF2158 family)